jgi:16S rRNA (guanine527-N7)-methyltransferase
MPPRGMIEALSAASGRDVSRETFRRIEAFVDLLTAAAAEQNLIARSTLDGIWERHILDSAQLVRFEPHAGASWLDIGSGAGLPGLVIALLVEGPVALVEPRRLRADFLGHATEKLGLSDRVTIHHAKVERLAGRFDVITARAVASLPRLLEISSHLSTKNTVWALPRGRNARTELAETQRAWQGVFHVEQSVTDPDSHIVVASGVGKKPWSGSL